MHAVRCSSLASSGHRCRRRTTDPRGICASAHLGPGTLASPAPGRVIGAASDGRHIRDAVAGVLERQFPSTLFNVCRSARREATVEWVDGPDEDEVLASALNAFGPGFGPGPDGRTLRAGDGSASSPALVLVRHSEEPWRSQFIAAAACP